VNINATFFAQLVVLFLLVVFTMKFVWPPIAAALDERALKIKSGLEAADRAKRELSAANERVEVELSASRKESLARLTDAERRAQALIEESKMKASEEAAKILASARGEVEMQVVHAREVLRQQVAALAVRGAEQILRREINTQVHVDLLNRLKQEL